MTQEEKDLLMAKVLDAPDTLTDQEIEQFIHDRELREMYHIAVLLKSGAATERTGKTVRLPRWAAAIVLILSLGAVATTITYRVATEPGTDSELSEFTEKPERSQKPKPIEEEPRLEESLTFNNQPLADIAKQITAIYGYKVVFADKETANLRLYFTLPKGSSATDFVKIIDEYETLSATIKDETITIKRQEARQ